MEMTRSTFLLVCMASSIATATTNKCSPLPLSQDECRKSLLPGQYLTLLYYCESVSIDEYSQSVIGCQPNGSVFIPCYAIPTVTCGGDDNNSSSPAFCKQEPCRYVNGQRYNYLIAVALSLFLGMFGIDRFYLGYPAIGLLKLCTIGFFFIGQLVDFLLIVVQAVGPSDLSAYYGPFYGPLLNDVNTTDSYLQLSDSSCI